MPNNPPPTVSASFLTALVALSWVSGHLWDGSHACYPHVNTDAHTWEIVTVVAARLTDATYLSLKGGAANGDGSYTDSSGSVWWLRLNLDGVAYPSAT